jgi:hypothetical protein
MIVLHLIIALINQQVAQGHHDIINGIGVAFEEHAPVIG